MDKFTKIKRASIWGIIGNLFLFVIKSIIGFLTNSQAMIADSFNSLTDIISSAMTFVGNRISSRPKDEDHDLGHGKAEYIYSMIISIVMFFLSSKLFIDSLKSLISFDHYDFSPWLIVVCLITIAIKFVLFLYTDKIAKTYDNLLIKANAIDHRNDCILTFFNMLSAILCSQNVYFFDGVVGVAIAVWIALSAWDIFKNSYNVLMDKAIATETKDKVLKIISSHEEVLKIDHFNSTPIGYLYQISFTIFVDGDLSTFDSHAIANHLEKEIDEKVPEIFLTVVHVNPLKIEKKKPKNKRKKKDSFKNHRTNR